MQQFDLGHSFQFLPDPAVFLPGDFAVVEQQVLGVDDLREGKGERKEFGAVDEPERLEAFEPEGGVVEEGGAEGVFGDEGVVVGGPDLVWGRTWGEEGGDGEGGGGGLEAVMGLVSGCQRRGSLRGT